MECCRPSRRQALLWGSLAAATPLVAGAAASPAAAASATPAAATTSSSSDILVTDLEVATVTELQPSSPRCSSRSGSAARSTTRARSKR
jgi:3',5'-cyclic-AMP phosphodiesterase